MAGRNKRERRHSGAFPFLVFSVARSRLEQIGIWQDGDKNLHVKVKTNGVWSPDGTELDMTFNDSGHTTGAWWD